MDKLYNLGVICGRFSHIHIGHENLIKHSLLLCNKTLILLGSAQEEKTLRNPFSFETRKEAIMQVYPDFEKQGIIIKPLYDLTNEYDITHEWGAYLKNTIEEYCGTFADILITGDDKSRSKCFAKEDLEYTSNLIVARKIANISATKIRAMLVLDEFEEWKKYTPQNLHSMYSVLRNKLMEVPIYQKIYEEVCTLGKTTKNFEMIYKKYEEADKQEKLKNITKA